MSSAQPMDQAAQVRGITSVPTRNCITGSNARNGAHNEMSDSANACRVDQGERGDVKKGDKRLD